MNVEIKINILISREEIAGNNLTNTIISWPHNRPQNIVTDNHQTLNTVSALWILFKPALANSAKI